MATEEDYVIDPQSIWPYIPIVLLYTLYVVVAIGYSTGATNGYLPWTSVVVASSGVLIGVVVMFRDSILRWWVYLWLLANYGEQGVIDAMDIESGGKNKKGKKRGSETMGARELDVLFQSSGTLDLIPSAIAYVVWLTYGILFQQFPVGDVVPQLVGVLWIIWLTVSQSRVIHGLEPMRKSMTLVLYIGMMFFPSGSAIATHLAWYTLLCKVTLFYVLYLLISAETVSTLSVAPASFKRGARWASSVERKITQSAWVLMTPAVFAIFAVLQAGILVWWILRHKSDWDKKTDAVTADSGKKKKKKKKKKRAPGTDPEPGYDTTTEDEGALYIPYGAPMGPYGVPAILPAQAHFPPGTYPHPTGPYVPAGVPMWEGSGHEPLPQDGYPAHYSHMGAAKLRREAEGLQGPGG